MQETRRCWKYSVSIHAPLARGDLLDAKSSGFFRCFNPRPSCEGRPIIPAATFLPRVFQSTPLLRGATAFGTRSPVVFLVSIHAPLARGDMRTETRDEAFVVSIHAPLARGDDRLGLPTSKSMGFNPRPSCEGRRAWTHQTTLYRRFNPRPSCEGRRM